MSKFDGLWELYTPVLECHAYEEVRQQLDKMYIRQKLVPVHIRIEGHDISGSGNDNPESIIGAFSDDFSSAKLRFITEHSNNPNLYTLLEYTNLQLVDMATLSLENITLHNDDRVMTSLMRVTKQILDSGGIVISHPAIAHHTAVRIGK